MSESSKVRASRDGDQFHYLWAARRALKLLMPQTGLIVLSIEGVSEVEAASPNFVEKGEELIDIAEYYGGEDIADAERVRYMQLKHSTLRVDEPWKPSELEKTIKGFADRYRSQKELLGSSEVNNKLEFWFVSNRSVHDGFSKVIKDFASKGESLDEVNTSKLRKFTGLIDPDLSDFCGLLRLKDAESDYWEQRNILSNEFESYLPGSDTDAPIRLKELITRKALSEFSEKPAITKYDLLRALHSDETALYPAPCLIEKASNLVTRQNNQELVSKIIDSCGNPVIIRADAGVGKTTFSTQLDSLLPSGSVSIIYDCFGNGSYRNASGYRHTHSIACTQIVNELSSKGLCYPLIPSIHADSSTYTRAFIHRLYQASQFLKSKDENVRLCIVVDAADNAQMMADELGEPNSFIRNLLRETLPDGVCLVATCRPHREVLLDPPSNSILVNLESFSRLETEVHLKKYFPEVNSHDVDEFHRLSSFNPRVQAFALSKSLDLSSTLRLLGPNPTSVEDTIGSLLEQSITALCDDSGDVDRSKINLICEGLAILRPVVPIAVLSAMSGFNEDTVRNFALELGRPVFLSGDAIQFLDEPAETWFRDKFRPDRERIKVFVERLIPLASSSAYVAAVLPQLMLEAEKFTELVDLALSSKGLPESLPIESRNIELQRLLFAIKAGLKNKEYKDVAKLAIKAGSESAGNSRQRELLRNNIDLIPLFMDGESAINLIARESFSGSWMGAHHAYEASILSGYEDRKGEARSRLRISEEWLNNWSQQSDDTKSKESPADNDIAEMVYAHLNIHGVESAANDLRRWSPRGLSYSVGKVIAKRLVDHGRFNELDDFAVQASNNFELLLALNSEAVIVGHKLPQETIQRCIRLISSSRIVVKRNENTFSLDEPAIAPIASIIETALCLKSVSTHQAIDILKRYLPDKLPHDISSKYSHCRKHYLKGYSLFYILTKGEISFGDLADEEIRKNLDSSSYMSSRDAEEYKEAIAPLLPWLNLWGRSILGEIDSSEILENIELAKKSTNESRGSYYHGELTAANEIVNIWIDTLCHVAGVNKENLACLIEWSNSRGHRVYTPTMNRLSRVSSDVDELKAFAFEYAQKAFSLLEADRENAEYAVEGYVDIARSLILASPYEAQEYFNKAIEVSGKVGDENISRWVSVLDLAEASVGPQGLPPKLIYEFSKCAEITFHYVEKYKHFPWVDTLRTLAKMCPRSALAIVSRWSDRHFGWDDRNRAVVIEQLVEQESLNPLDALVMLAFHSEWHDNKLIGAALSKCDSSMQKEALMEIVYRYSVLESQNEKKWRDFDLLLNDSELELPYFTDLDSVFFESNSYKSNLDSPFKNKESEDSKWDEFFGGCELTSSEVISGLFKKLYKGEPPIDRDGFLLNVCKRSPVGQEPNVISALTSSSEFSFYDVSRFLEIVNSIPDWKGRLSIQRSIYDFVKACCKRFCTQIRRDRFYSSFPFDLALELSGMGEESLYEEVLLGIASYSGDLGSDSLFSLTSILKEKLSREESEEVLNYALSWYDKVKNNSDGDGEWSEALAPCGTVEESLAGYIWARLASPDVAVRWEAAHAVVALCKLERHSVIESLIVLAGDETPQKYYDQQFYFYQLSAIQWLLIAFSRAAIECGEVLTPHVDFFWKYSNRLVNHIFIRHYSSITLVELRDRGLIDIDESEYLSLKTTIDPDKGYVSSEDNCYQKNGYAKDESYSFGIDFGPYWLRPLANCFGISQSEVEGIALKVIREDLGYEKERLWDADERAKQKLYDYQETSHSHGSSPNIELLDFYLSYHAMMITAGKLLKEKPLVQGSAEWERAPFIDWFKSHDISRSDQRWLADRRDPQPRFNTIWPNSSETNIWVASMSKLDFDSALYIDDRYLCMHGSWTETNGQGLFKSVSISSALVSESTSFSLLRALQTASDSHDYKLPGFQDDLQITEKNFTLKGWVVDEYRDGRLDEKDPWAGGIGYSVPEPSGEVKELMRLSHDVYKRNWFSCNTKDVLISSHVWGYRTDSNDSEKPSGKMLKVSKSFLGDLLKQVEMDMILEVSINRRSSYGTYRRGNDDGENNIPASTRLYVLKRDGKLFTV